MVARSGLVQFPRPGPSVRAATGARWLTLALIVVLVLLPLLTYASPPDPSWIDGYWDDDDFDDVVVLILTTHAVVVIPVPVAGPVWTDVAVQEPPDVPTPALPPLTLVPQRAPPLVASHF